MKAYDSIMNLCSAFVVDSNLMKMKNLKDIEKPWKSNIAKTITFIVTKDCQLACKYCYLVGKNNKERMSWDTAKKAIDYILSQENEYPSPGLSSYIKK